MMPPPYRSYVLVSLDRIARNYRNVCAAVGPGVEVMAVVKADAYGHGALAVSRTLVGEGAKWLAVSSVDEGVALRTAGIGVRILVMAGFLPQEREAVVQHDLTPTAHSLDDIAELDRMAGRAGRPLAFHLKIDSGMGRLGTRAQPQEIVAALGALGHARLEGLMTHFASAGNYSSAQTDEQLACFHAIRETLAGAGLTPRYQHLSSTIPVAYGRRQAWGNMVRPGHAIYGYLSPARGDAPAPLLESELIAGEPLLKAMTALPDAGFITTGPVPRALSTEVVNVPPLSVVPPE